MKAIKTALLQVSINRKLTVFYSFWYWKMIVVLHELKDYLDLDLIDAQISSTVCAAGQEHLVEVWRYFIDCKEGDKVCITL